MSDLTGMHNPNEHSSDNLWQTYFGDLIEQQIDSLPEDIKSRIKVEHLGTKESEQNGSRYIIVEALISLTDKDTGVEHTFGFLGIKGGEKGKIAKMKVIGLGMTVEEDRSIDSLTSVLESKGIENPLVLSASDLSTTDCQAFDDPNNVKGRIFQKPFRQFTVLNTPAYTTPLVNFIVQRQGHIRPDQHRIVKSIKEAVKNIIDIVVGTES